MSTLLLLLLLILNCYSSISSDSELDKSVPKLGQEVSSVTRDLDSNLQILCGVEKGAQPLFFEWFKQGQLIRSGSAAKYEIETSKRSSTLFIEHITKEDAGNYSCIVKNAYGSDSINVLLTVKGKIAHYTFYFSSMIFNRLILASIDGAMVSVNLLSPLKSIAISVSFHSSHSQ